MFKVFVKILSFSYSSLSLVSPPWFSKMIWASFGVKVGDGNTGGSLTHTPLIHSADVNEITWLLIAIGELPPVMAEGPVVRMDCLSHSNACFVS